MPHYPVGSVDRALRLIHMLRDRGELRIKDAAAELGVSESTVHRIMSMLVFHGFAMQEDNRAYIAGYALGAGPAPMLWTKILRDAAISHMEDLRTATGETVNIAVRVGAKIRFLWSLEGNREMHIVNRTGRVMPAVRTAGGRVILANMSEDVLQRLYQGRLAEAQGDAMTEREFKTFIRGLRIDYRNGYATANQETELGVAAVAMPLRDETGRVIAAMSVSAPGVRFRELLSESTLIALKDARDATEHAMHDLSFI